ncbi:MAG: glycyl-radical enzyme activating protein [Clostridiales bacterium]|nr:glycyl-radical enzyme activating protein [Clostridiales bacterium]
MGQSNLIFNIQRYSVHDGPGIRTIIFFKGCPLRCPWCANPEGQSFSKDFMHNDNLCTKCGRCADVCSVKAVEVKDGQWSIDREKCIFCKECLENCPSNAIKIFGDEIDVDQILEEVAKDEIFYRRSGGGITVSGGEPLSQPELLIHLLKKAKKDYQMHTAIETSLYCSESILREAIQYLDYILCDIKLANDKRHQEIIQVSNEGILNNIRIIADEFPEKKLLLRVPVIPSINDDEENIWLTASFIKSLKREVPLELLPYHCFGKAKYEGIGMKYDDRLKKIQPPEKEFMKALEKRFTAYGVHVIET